ncbi:hypothetical protein K466DRAFT_523884 [Polyporus arcularius HHB13444]|uniref:F-box domain-containing protein n=1 Tax=Polyporus arcularius HHB13444 TaxID=1314778 RepID=A0A5C3PA72_9APHY|nr:hypothetical protein K466DRAFT_523884 [Polyporus arcularius HHB13444]
MQASAMTERSYNGPTIHCLPDEILVYIFVYISEAGAWRKRFKYEFTVRPRRRHNGYWTLLMLVCRRWREVGRTSARLWRAIDIDSRPEWLRLALERSQGAALELYFHSPPTALSSISLVTQQAHRLRKLLLPSMEGAHLPVLHSLFSTDMPILNELRLWVEDNADTPQADPASIRFSASRFPRLRYLRLSHITFQWEPSAISNLRFLHLHNCHSLDSSLPFEEFLDVLSSGTELEELRLNRFISTIAHNVPTGFERNVSLPQLRKLVVGDVPHLTALFLSSITLPSDITLRVIGLVDAEILVNAQNLLLASLLPTDHGRLPVLQAVTKVTFDRNYDEFHVCGVAPNASITLKLRSELDLEGLYTECALTEVAQIFQHAPVTELDIDCGPDTVDERGVWVHLFAFFDRVRSLHVLPGQAVRPIWHALGGWSYPWEEPEDYQGVLCPELRVLDIEHLQWDEEAMDFILASLRRRHLRGLPKLDSLNIGFTYDIDSKSQRDGVVTETDLMIPSYEDHLSTYTAKFTWSRN